MIKGGETGILLEHLFRRQSGRMVAHLARVLGPAHLSLAEESAQEAMLRALQVWPHQGIPENAEAWLFRVARNFAIDAIRRDRVLGEKTEAIAGELARWDAGAGEWSGLEDQLNDDELRMIFLCCHPQLSRDVNVVLSLKIVGGFSVREIARSLLAQESAIAQRLVRAKREIRERKVRFEMPDASELPRRLDAVLEVIYFTFNEGYAAHDGDDLIRQDVCLEALRLARLLASSSIATPRVHALAALIALQAARLPARVDGSGDLVLLDDQDRSLWDYGLIALGFHHFNLAIAGDAVSEYHVQAAIAATYARAVQHARVQWDVILALYDQLLAINPSPVVVLNRAVTVAKVRGPAEALSLIEPLQSDVKMRDYYLLLAVRGGLLLDLGRNSEAAACFRAALDRAGSLPERRFLSRRLEQCSAVLAPG